MYTIIIHNVGFLEYISKLVHNLGKHLQIRAGLLQKYNQVWYEPYCNLSKTFCCRKEVEN